MKLYLRSIYQLAALCLFCVLIKVRESGGTFVPGRCVCPETQGAVRGHLRDLKVIPKSPTCHKYTVIVFLKRNNEAVCLNPEAPMGKQLIRCWNRASKLGRDVRLCLRRRRRGQQQQQQQQQQRGFRQRKPRGQRSQNRRSSSSHSSWLNQPDGQYNTTTTTTTTAW